MTTSSRAQSLPAGAQMLGSSCTSAPDGGSSRRSSRPRAPATLASFASPVPTTMLKGRPWTCTGTTSSTGEFWTKRAGKTWPVKVRRPAPVRSFSAHLAVELHHGDRSEHLPGALPGRHQDRRLPDGAAAQGAPTPRVNLFIADDTGLGKTIEAGLIARELLTIRARSSPMVPLGSCTPRPWWRTIRRSS